MIRHALAEGWLLLHHRWPVTFGLALSLAVPLALAGITWSVMRWIEPVAGLAEEATVVPVLLHPQMDAEQRREWIEERGRDHPEWRIEEVSAARLAERLARWFPYLDELLSDGGDAMLSPLVEITTAEPEGVAVLERSPAVVAVGPRSSVRRALGRAARVLGWSLGVTTGALLVAAGLFTAVWVHLELYRHADEITIMRLIGATEPAVRGPFIVATVAPGVVASALAVTGTLWVLSGFSRTASALGLPAVEGSAAVVGVQLALGCGLPLLAAVVTLSRHAAADVDA